MSIKCTYRQLAALRNQSDRAGGVLLGPIAKLNKVDESLVPAIMDRIRISRFVKAIITETIKYERSHLDLLKKHGILDEKDKSRYLIPVEGQSDYQEAMQNLDGTETEVPTSPLPASVIEKVSLSVEDLSVLEPFISVPGDIADPGAVERRSKHK